MQEQTYVIPTHWFVDPRTRRGRQKYGRRRMLFDLVPGSLAGKRVLDYGCGDGWITHALVERGAAVDGVDFSERALAFARILVPGATFATNDGTALPFPDHTFDFIFFLEVLEHVPPANVPMVLAELRRVLKPEGALILSVPSMCLDVRRFRAHFRHFTPHTLAETLAPIFRCEEMRGQDDRGWWVTFLSTCVENRWWTLWGVARVINQGVYLRFWNSAPLARAGHLFARCLPV